MCLAVPGKLVDIKHDASASPDGVSPMGTVDFDGVRREVCLAYTPEAKVGDYVVVHVGFAMSVLAPKEAEDLLAMLDELARLNAPTPDPRDG